MTLATWVLKGSAPFLRRPNVHTKAKAKVHMYRQTYHNEHTKENIVVNMPNTCTSRVVVGTKMFSSRTKSFIMPIHPGKLLKTLHSRVRTLRMLQTHFHIQIHCIGLHREPSHLLHRTTRSTKHKQKRSSSSSSLYL